MDQAPEARNRLVHTEASVREAVNVGRLEKWGASPGGATRAVFGGLGGGWAAQ